MKLLKISGFGDLRRKTLCVNKIGIPRNDPSCQIGHFEFKDLTDFPARPHFRKPVSVCPYVETVQKITRTTPPETSIR